MLLLRFLHMTGMCLWIGGMGAAMVIAVASRTESDTNGALVRMLGRIYTAIVAPGAALTVLTGLALTMSLAQRGASQVMGQPRIWVMQVTGLVAGVLVLGVALPAASGLIRIASVEGGLDGPHGDRLRRRLSAVAHLAGVLSLVALFFATYVR